MGTWVSRGYVNTDVRRRVAARADGLCEYCLVHDDHTYNGCEVDHIRSIKHGGSDEFRNLAFACFKCNRSNGTDIGSILPRQDTFTRLYDPRIDPWARHFRLDHGIFIIGITEIGTATARVLKLNAWNRVAEREVLRDFGLYPLPAARKRMMPADESAQPGPG
ncbi:MAG TPA: HNH endonuclease signature motif containing protein [Longimicrobium sp.]|nr:HNH endonuclease signature motif containing protein [Longimicrobium sp.]